MTTHHHHLKQWIILFTTLTLPVVQLYLMEVVNVHDSFDFWQYKVEVLHNIIINVSNLYYYSYIYLCLICFTPMFNVMFQYWQRWFTKGVLHIGLYTVPAEKCYIRPSTLCQRSCCKYSQSVFIRQLTYFSTDIHVPHVFLQDYFGPSIYMLYSCLWLTFPSNA